MSNSQYDAVIVLGAGLNLDASVPDQDKARLQKAAELYNEKSTKAIIVCGGQGYKVLSGSGSSESETYAHYLYELGIPEAGVYLESDSQETVGNILFSKMNIVMKHDWRKILIIPTANHSTERVAYLAGKIFGSTYGWTILRVGENVEIANLEREAKATKISREINDKYGDGDHQAIYQGLMETHPAYGGTKWTLDELREEMKPQG